MKKEIKTVVYDDELNIEAYHFEGIVISTKILLADFQPVEILFFRFVMGFAVLLIISPKRLKSVSFRRAGNSSFGNW